MDANLYLFIEKSNCCVFVVLFIEEIEVYIAVVDYEEMDDVFAVFFKMF